MKSLRKQEARSEGGGEDVDSSSDEEEERGEAGSLLGGEEPFSMDEETGTLAWETVVERIRLAGVSVQVEDDDDEASTEGSGGKPRRSWGLPVALFVYLLPCVLLSPFYAAVFATSYSAVGNVQTSEVRDCRDWPHALFVGL